MQSDGESFVVTSTRIVASTDIDTSSDRRLKNNISSDLDRYIPFFMRLQPSVYRFNSGRSGRFHTGFIAQEVEDALRDSGLSTQDFAGLVKCSGLNDAPITGRTGRVTFSTGNYITPTSGSLVTITGIDEVYVKFPISERDFLSLFGTQEKMKKDALVSVNLANGKAYDQPGKIFMTDNTVQPTTDTLNVWARFPNPEDVLTPGGVVTVNLSKKNVDRFPAANISSVMHDAYKSYVYVVNDQGVVERRDVTLGNTVNNEQCFSSGVKEGEVIIIDGMHKVRPGAKVNPVYSAQN